MYKTSNDEWKGILERHYGKKFFSQDVNDRIDGWEDMMAETGRPDVPEFVDLPEDLRDHFQKYYRVIVMNEAYNQGEKMDIYNTNIYRHFPWFRTNGSASGFAFGGAFYDYSLASAGSGSRLALKSEKSVKVIGTKHIDIMREYLES
ncbi:hypothetical protein [Dysgonomonas macrotermitis]|uniref:hypothetical protein n=1 Tax=Dysgonomonas macrotermitis TaxID=1346286 RepID=UPI001114BB11|nr:hypothetical protein [Dysgonomonas macrotermitis]